MRGKPDTDNVLTVLRKGEAKPLTFKLTRAVIKSQSVKSKFIEPGFGYVRITQFQEHTGEDLAKALIALQAQNKGPFKGLVLDMRNNPGGLLDAAVGVSAAFLPRNDLVVYTEGRVARFKNAFSAVPQDYARRGKGDYLKDVPEDYKKTPMVVLVMLVLLRPLRLLQVLCKTTNAPPSWVFKVLVRLCADHFTDEQRQCD